MVVANELDADGARAGDLVAVQDLLAEERIVLDGDGRRAVPGRGRVERLGTVRRCAGRDRDRVQAVAAGGEAVVRRVVVRARADELWHADRNGGRERPLVIAAGADQADPAAARFNREGLDLLADADGPAVAPGAHRRVALAERQPVDGRGRIYAVVCGERDVAAIGSGS